MIEFAWIAFLAVMYPALTLDGKKAVMWGAIAVVVVLINLYLIKVT